MHQPAVFAIFFVLAWITWKLLRIGLRPSNYPPGPPALPLLGNLHQMPTKDAHLHFQKWSETYGSIYSVMAGTRTVVFLNTDVAVKELLDRRGAIYSSRPDSYMINLLTGRNNFGLMPNNNTWKQCRAIFQNALGPQSLDTIVRPYQDLESKQMLHDLCVDPSRFKHHLRRYINSVAYQLILGFRVADCQDRNLEQVFDIFESWNEMLSQVRAIVLDLYPLLRSLPDFLLPVKKDAQMIQEEEKSFYLGHFQSIKQKIRSGTAQPCLAESVLKAQEAHAFPDELASSICGDMIQAGSDVTAKELMGFVLAMVLFPETQKRAQEELDRVCGHRLPDLNDAPNLPYIRACVKEVLRWMPSAFLGIPHASTEDDQYLGYKIPKGAIIIPNAWAIQMDEKRHPEPRRFEPARYLGDNTTAHESAILPDPRQRDHFTFGAGRRLCLGIDVADTSMFLAIARMLWAFDFAKAKDGNGNEVSPDPEAFTAGLAAGPVDFPADITPRSEKHAEILKMEWESAQTKLDEDMQWKHAPSGTEMPS